MTQKFFQGRTNNHLTWVMVDATDFATPESALSAATKIKIYGKLQGATGVNFVSSGTGSLTNDIQHVGASVLGIYTIALAKADLSDASAAWYDQYVISLSATGAAYQTLVAEGVLAGGIVSNVSAAISDTQSYLAAMSGVLSDTYSAIIITQSMASDAHSAATQGSSRALVMQSMISDVDSALTSQFNATSDAISNAYSAAVVGASRALLAQSMASDAHSAAAQGNSRVLLVQSRLSDLDSRLVSDVSDILSVVRGNSDAISDVHSYLVGMSGMLSDIDSAVTSQYSDVISKIGAITVTITPSDISDIASATAAAVGFTPSAIAAKVWSDYTSMAGATPSQQYSVLLLAASRVSDVQSYLVGMSGMLSDVDSALTSQFNATSDAISDVKSAVLLTQSMVSDVDSALTSQFNATSDALSNIKARLPAALTGGGNMKADILATNGDTTAAANVAKTTRAIGRGTVTSGATTTSVPTSAFSPSGAVADQFKGRIITFDADTTTAALRGQSTDITASSNAAAPTFTVTALTTAPSSGDTFSVT